MSISVPGRIVVVDNSEEDVRDTIKSFWEAGESVTFFQSIPEKDKIPPNVRVLILDIALSSEELRIGEDIPQLALILRHIVSKTKLCLVVLWSRHIDETGGNFIDEIKEEYRTQTAEDVPCTIFFIPFGKGSINQKRLAEEVRGWIEKNPHAGIVFEWEKLIEEARDLTVSDIVSAGEIQTLIASIKEEVGKESVCREIVSLFNRILQRRVFIETRIAPLNLCVQRVIEWPTKIGDILEWYSNLHHLNTYYIISASEPHWTGDIFKTDIEGDSEQVYAIVITPSCDFAQKKVGKFKVVYGTKFRKISNYNREGEDNIPAVVGKIGKKKDHYRDRESILNMLFGIEGQRLRENFYVLFFLREDVNTHDYFHLLLDFQNVGSFKSLPTTWGRICRVDSPWIDDILQKYSSHSARIGTPEIPEDARKAELKKCKDE